MCDLTLVSPYLGEGEGLGGLLGGMGVPSEVNSWSVDAVDLTVSDRDTLYFPPSRVIICRARVFFLHEEKTRDCSSDHMTCT